MTLHIKIISSIFFLRHFIVGRYSRNRHKVFTLTLIHWQLNGCRIQLESEQFSWLFVVEFYEFFRSHFCKVNFGSLFSALIFCRSSELICLCVQLNFRGSCASMSANFVCSLFIFQLYIVMVFTTTRTDISITCYFDRFSEPSKLYWYLMMFNFLSWWNTHTHTPHSKRWKIAGSKQ